MRRASPHIDLILAGGSAIGLGHVMRCGALADTARRRGLSVRVFLKGDAGAHAAWRDSALAAATDPVRDWREWQAETSAPISLLDFPGDKTPWLDVIPRSRSRRVVLDDASQLERADLTILPALHHHARLATGTAPVLLGPRYSILALAHRQTPHAPLAERDALLLSIGGADPHAATPRLAPLIARNLVGRASSERFRSRHVVLGAAYRDPDETVQRTLARDGWHVHRAIEPREMARLMASARLAVMGFGTSLSELAWHGTPHLSVTHQLHDVPLAEGLEAQGIGRHLGPAGQLDPPHVEARIAGALYDLEWQNTSASLARQAIGDGRGCEHIVDRLLELGCLNSPSESPSPHKSGRPKGSHVPLQ